LFTGKIRPTYGVSRMIHSRVRGTDKMRRISRT
jgi:hypothetical protein